MVQKPDRSTYTAQDFQQWREAGALELTPKFQRRGVWSLAARSYFIDTLLRQMPAPPIYIRILQAPEKKRAIRQVVDGQQRVAAILDFLDGKFRLSKSIAGEWARKKISDLTAEEQNRIVSYGFPTETFQGISDLEVLEIFARLNTYSVPLNAQELRNGRYFGPFKQSAYSLAHQHLEFWRRHKVFSERKIARMLEVELTSELLIAQIEGMQDKKKSIDSFYKEFDEEYPKREKNETRFKDVIDILNETFPDTLADSEFSRPPLFYTLYCVVFHRRYGLPEQEVETPAAQMTKSDRALLAEAAQQLSEVIAEGRAKLAVPKTYEKFVAACLRQTDNIQPRQDRFKFLYARAFKKK